MSWTKPFMSCLAGVVVFLSNGCMEVARRPLPVVPADQLEPLARFIREHGRSPEDYIISKFADHDIVFVGEYHRIKHDAKLIQNLIPRLHEAGVNVLAIEFGITDFQPLADGLVQVPEYNEALARWLMFRFLETWGYVEYMDLYRTAWELNQSLPDDARPFRILHLGYRPNWSAAGGEVTPENEAKVWYRGSGDAYMAETILKEIVAPGDRALVYCGIHHAFTRYRSKTLRTGNIVYDQIGDRACTIALHAPWSVRPPGTGATYPVDGVIDRVMRVLGNPRVGFDVRGTPFGALRDDDAYYAASSGFKLADFCDGYVYQRPISEYEGCTVDVKFVTRENFDAFRHSFVGSGAPPFLHSPADAIRMMRRAADMKSRFRELE